MEAVVVVAVLPLLHLPAAVMAAEAEAVLLLLHPPVVAVVVPLLRHSRVAAAEVAVTVETVALWAAPPSELPIRYLLRLRNVPRKRRSR
jgi:hypothetical protein